MNNELKLFRIISIIEGLSLIVLLGIAMPAKYYFGEPALVSYVGMAHGILWLVYIVVSLGASHKAAWSVLFWLWSLLLSVVPFGFILLDWQIKRAEKPTQ